MNPNHIIIPYFFKILLPVSKSHILPFPFIILARILYAFITFSLHGTCPAKRILLHLITLVISDEQYKFRSFFLCNFLQSFVISPLLGPNILLSSMCSHTSIIGRCRHRRRHHHLHHHRHDHHRHLHLHGWGNAWPVQSSWRVCWSHHLNCGCHTFCCPIELHIKIFGIPVSFTCRVSYFHCDLNFRIWIEIFSSTLIFVFCIWPFIV